MLNYNQIPTNVNPQKSLRENKSNDILSESLKETFNTNTENNFSSKTNTEVRSSSAEINKKKSKDLLNDEDKNLSAKSNSPKKDPYREIVTLNLFEIVKDDLRDDTISETKSGKSKKQRSKHSSSREKHKPKISSESNLFLDSTDPSLVPKEVSHSGRSNKNISPESAIKSVKKMDTKSQYLSSNYNNFSIMNSNQDGSFEKDIIKPLKETSFRENSPDQGTNTRNQGAGDFEKIMRYYLS